MGAGNWEKDPDTGEVYLLLAAEQGIYPKHLHFRFDRFGRLTLHARQKGVELNGEPITRGTSRLLSHTQFIKIVPLSYKFFHILPKDDEQAFQSAKNQFLLDHMGFKEVPNEISSATPSADDVRIGDWAIHGTADSSATTVVEAASNMRTFQVVAVKRLRRMNWSDDRKIEAEVSNYDGLESIKAHSHGKFVMRKHVIYKTQKEWLGQPDEVYLLWTPLGLGTFREFSVSGKWSFIAPEVRRTLFCQVCLGVQAVHELGWMHRDIKPANLYMVSLSPPRAVVGDFGSAIRVDQSGFTPEPGHYGTIGWLAPEMENPEFAPKYTQAVDVWSLGAVAYYLFMPGRLPRVSRRGHNTFLHDDDPAQGMFQMLMDDLSSSKSESLIHQMLQPRPDKRIHLRRVLAIPALRDTMRALEASSVQDVSTGSKRSAS